MSTTTADGLPETIAWNREALAPGPEQDAVVRGITGEITDKGYVNQRAVRERRAHHVELLTGEDCPPRVVARP